MYWLILYLWGILFYTVPKASNQGKTLLNSFVISPSGREETNKSHALPFYVKLCDNTSPSFLLTNLFSLGFMYLVPVHFRSVEAVCNSSLNVLSFRKDYSFIFYFFYICIGNMIFGVGRRGFSCVPVIRTVINGALFLVTSSL